MFAERSKRIRSSDVYISPRISQPRTRKPTPPHYQSLTIKKPTPVPPLTVGLPPEILQIVFWYATGMSSGFEKSLWETSYTPFQDSGWLTSVLPFDERRAQERGALWQVKNTISLVSRQWYALAIEFLLEEIRVGPHSPSLEALAKYGHWVRRIELWPGHGHTPRLVDILRVCPRVEIICKVDSTVLLSSSLHPFWDDIHELEPHSLSSLKRLDWALTEADVGGRPHILRSLVAAAPNLQHLVATSIMQPAFNALTLPNLHTLRFPLPHTVEVLGLGSAMPNSPNLRHVVLNRIFVHCMRLITDASAFAHVQSIELQDGVDLTASTLASMLQIFPRCSDLALPAGTVTLHDLDGRYLHIKRIRLYANPILLLRNITHWMNDNYQQLMYAFPAVEEVVLHGDWRFVMMPFHMDNLKEDLFNRSCTLTFT